MNVNPVSTFTQGWAIALLLSTALASPARAAFDYHPALKSFQADLESEDKLKMAQDGDRALAGLIKMAVRELNRQGYPEKAAEVQSEYAEYANYLYITVMQEQQGLLGDIGDHNPLSAWLTKLYNDLESILGFEVCHFLHLDDINTMNYVIPVVFHLKVLGGDQIGEPEYALHFVPFSGITAYWTIWAICEVGTSGTAWVLVCMPAGTGAEIITERFIAPPLAPKIYPVFWKNQ